MRMRKRMAVLLSLTLIFFILSGCGHGVETEPDYTVVIATDIHYLAPTLTDHGPLFRQVMEAGDGKVTEYCDEITDAFLDEVRSLRPDALILTGDLSFNGERESHELLAQKLAALEAEGVPVLVLPGNHDLFRSSACSFFGEEAAQVPGVTGEEFREIYASFGFDEAIAADDDSLSYVSQLNESTRVLMLDANTLHDYCGFSEKTLAWVREQLKKAAEDGQAVLAACHQNLYRHSMFDVGYVLSDGDELQRLFETCRVPVMLSGHMHIQHIMTEGGVTEIACSALTMGACQYGVLEAGRGGIRYETRRVAVSDWASKRGLGDEALADFADYALSSMEKRTRTQAEAQLAACGFERAEIAELTEYACALNDAYFIGDLSKIPELDPDGGLLKRWEDSGTFFGVYFASLERDIGKDYTKWSSIGN